MWAQFGDLARVGARVGDVVRVGDAARVCDAARVGEAVRVGDSAHAAVHFGKL